MRLSARFPATGRAVQCSVTALTSPPQRRSLRRQWSASRKPPTATDTAPALRVRTAAAAASERPSGRPAHDPDSAILVLAGFHLEELATVRALLDQVGGEAVRVVPTTPALLYAPATEALHHPEAPWDRPVPADWLPGGGWGQQRMVLMAGIVGEGQQMVLELLEEGGMPGVVPAVATPDNWDMRLGELLADALKTWRQQGGSAGTAAAAAAAAAGAGAGAEGQQQQQQEDEEEEEEESLVAAEAELGVEFVDDLPPLESVVPAEVWNPESTARSGSGGGSRDSNVVQAEFSESPQRQERGSAAASTGQQVPVEAVGADASATTGREQWPVNAAKEEEEEEEMDSEELLAAAKAAMGLDDAKLQQLVDDAAVKAAAAFNIPFVPGGFQAAADEARPATPPQEQAPAAAAAPSTSTRGPMPWDPPTAAKAKPARTAAAVPAPKRGFAPSSTAKKSVRKGKGGSKAAGTKAAAPLAPAAAATATPAKSQAAEPSTGSAEAAATRAAADEGAAEPRSGAVPESPPPAADNAESAIPDNDRPIPSTDQFILSKAQLMKLSEKHNINFAELEEGLASKGIKLAE